jgi:hypothetical protein
VEEALGDRWRGSEGRWGFPDRAVATLWWDGSVEG